MDTRADGYTATGLFGYLHPDLFRLLCGPNAFLYADLLEYLDTEAIGPTSGILSRKAVVGMIADFLAQRGTTAELEADGLDLREEDRKGPDTRHHVAYARLVQTGWLIETRDRYRVVVDFDPHARMLLQALTELRSGRTRSYGGAVLQVCTLIESAIGDPELRSENLREAMRSTRTFMNDLRRISGALRKAERLIMSKTDATGLFGSFFTDFVERFVIADWKRLNTEHNPFRFRNRVRGLCQDTLDDRPLFDALSAAYQRDGRGEDLEEARRIVDSEVRTILRIFNSIDGYLDLIDEAKQRIEQRILNTARFMDRLDGAAATRIAAALKVLGDDPTRSDDEIDVQPGLIRFTLPIGGAHLFQSARRKAPIPPQTIRRKRPDPAHLALQRAIWEHQARITMTPDKLAAFAEKALAGRDSAIGSLIPIDGLDDFLAFERLREIAAFADGVLADRYQVDILPGIIDNQWIRCRDFVLRRANKEIAHG